MSRDSYAARSSHAHHRGGAAPYDRRRSGDTGASGGYTGYPAIHNEAHTGHGPRRSSTASSSSPRGRKTSPRRDPLTDLAHGVGKLVKGLFKFAGVTGTVDARGEDALRTCATRKSPSHRRREHRDIEPHGPRRLEEERDSPITGPITARRDGSRYRGRSSSNDNSHDDTPGRTRQRSEDGRRQAARDVDLQRRRRETIQREVDKARQAEWEEAMEREARQRRRRQEQEETARSAVERQHRRDSRQQRSQSQVRPTMRDTSTASEHRTAQQSKRRSSAGEVKSAGYKHVRFSLVEDLNKSAKKEAERRGEVTLTLHGEENRPYNHY